MSDAPARIWLCADDYGMSPGVNAAIRELIARGRINATSVMTVAPSFQPSEVQALDAAAGAPRRAAIGLHVTLTAPYRPMSNGYAPTDKDGAFLPLGSHFSSGTDEESKQFEPDVVLREIGIQLSAFSEAFGHPPDFIDGHQHVHLLWRVRDSVLRAAKAMAPNAWVRQCGRRLPFWERFFDPKGLFLDFLSRKFRALAAAKGVATNSAFAGTYSFHAGVDYAKLFPKFLRNLPDKSVVMCHPGHVDDELKRVDRLTTLREREYEYFASESFPAVLVAHGIALATLDPSRAS